MRIGGQQFSHCRNTGAGIMNLQAKRSYDPDMFFRSQLERSTIRFGGRGFLRLFFGEGVMGGGAKYWKNFSSRFSLTCSRENLPN